MHSRGDCGCEIGSCHHSAIPMQCGLICYTMAVILLRALEPVKSKASDAKRPSLTAAQFLLQGCNLTKYTAVSGPQRFVAVVQYERRAIALLAFLVLESQHF